MTLSINQSIRRFPFLHFANDDIESIIRRYKYNGFLIVRPKVMREASKLLKKMV